MPKDVIYGPQFKRKVRARTHRRRLEGVQHRHQRAPLAPLPGEPLVITATTSGPLPFAEVCCWYWTDDIPPTRLSFERTSVAWDELIWDYVQYWSATLPAFAAGAWLRYQVGGRVAVTYGDPPRWIYADNQAASRETATQFAISIDGSAPPGWARAALVYHIFLDRFHPGDGVPWNETQSIRDFYGGTLRGVIQKLDYIASLGMNAIWLSPIFASPTHHGYDATDLFAVEPRLGTNADLEELVAAAHARGVRILLDFVPNHWSNQHSSFLHAREHADSPYRDWYLWQDWPDDYVSYFGVPTMPKLNLAPGGPVRQHLIDAAAYWLGLGVDGFRLDHANGPPHDFWAEFRRACLRANPDCWLFGEVVEPPPVQLGYQGSLHGNLDFALARALRATFALGSWDLAQFDAFLGSHERFFPAGFSRPAFFDNHDMNRLLFLADGDEARLKLAALALFSLEGQPVIYYGTEAGVSQENSTRDGVGLDEARQPMLWGEAQNSELVEYFRKLASLRGAHPIPEGAARRTVHLDPRKGTYAFHWGSDSPLFLSAFNLGRDPQTLRVPAIFPVFPQDHLGGQPVTQTGDTLEITLAPQTGAFIS